MTDNKTVESLIKDNRDFMKAIFEGVPFESDQMKKVTQPPLAKEQSSDQIIALTKDFDKLMIEKDYFKLINSRRSCRKFSKKGISLDQLAFLLWSTQGVQSISGNNYATLRPVPSGGARHPFETYLIVRSVKGLKMGVYHYLPLQHALEFIAPVEEYEPNIDHCLYGQRWGIKSAVVFFYSIVPYRCEWRYAHLAHKSALLDCGHVMQNLYLSCEAVGLATCALATYHQHKCDEMLKLNGENEFVIYVAPVGVRETEKK